MMRIAGRGMLPPVSLFFRFRVPRGSASTPERGQGSIDDSRDSVQNRLQRIAHFNLIDALLTMPLG